MYGLLTIAVSLTAAGLKLLGNEASVYVAFGPHGEVAVAERKDILHMYRYSGGAYHETSSTPPTAGVSWWGRKYMTSSSHIYLQDNTNTPTHRLSPALALLTTHNHPGILIGCLAESPVYAEKVRGRAWQVTVRRPEGTLTLTPPQGHWGSEYMYMCSSADSIFIVAWPDKDLDIFSHTGNIPCVVVHVNIEL